MQKISSGIDLDSPLTKAIHAAQDLKKRFPQTNKDGDLDMIISTMLANNR